MQEEKQMAWTLDKAHSSFAFSVKHMVVATVRGRFTDFAVDADINEDDLTKSSATVSVDIASVDTGEAGRDQHLRSADFFHHEEHPQMTFVSKRIESKGGNEYRLVGDLTIRGATRDVTLDGEVNGPVKDPYGNNRIGITGEGKINRKDFGLNWNALLEAGGAVVADTVKLDIDVELVNPAA
jgi:polyisoprenoid-binding protein YceI